MFLDYWTCLLCVIEIQDNGQYSVVVIFEDSVIEAHLYVKKTLLDYFATLASFPLSSTDACKEYRVLACKQMYAQIMTAFDSCLATAEEVEYTRVWVPSVFFIVNFWFCWFLMSSFADFNDFLIDLC